MASWLCSLILISFVSVPTDAGYITVNNGGYWGTWGDMESCPDGYLAKGFSLKVEDKQGKGDDTAVNAIRLHCLPHYSTTQESTVTSAQGPWGSWTSPFWCLGGFLQSFSLKVEPPQRRGDDTAINNIKFKCSDGRHLEGAGLPWGSYGSWSEECELGICGILTRVEKPQGKGDDTALNDVQLSCCSKVYGNNN
ncbi:vitelline membrane outer layer protein 1 homolog [Pelodytes ibericus]